MDLTELERRTARLEARAEIENVIGRHFHLLMACEGARIMEQIWAHDEHISLEIGASGVYSGRKKVATYYQKDHLPGKFTLLAPVTPVIDVAADAEQAAGVWFGLGLETDAGDLGPEQITDPDRRALFSSSDADGRAYTAEWMLQKIAADFVCECGVWKMLHLHIYEIVRFPQDSDWVKYAQERYLTDGLRLDAMFRSNQPFAEDAPPENLPDAGTTYHWQYTPDRKTEYCPQV